MTKKLALDTTTFLRIQKWYLVAIAGIALTIIFAQVLIQQHLNSQLNDSRVINIAGRQRAYSQKLVKEALLIGQLAENSSTISAVEKKLKETLRVWKISHLGLQFGNDSIGLPKEKNENILKQFHELNQYHEAMVTAVERILSNQKSIEENTKVLLENEQFFLTKMDGIVNTYDEASKAQLEKLKLKEVLLFAFSLLILNY